MQYVGVRELVNRASAGFAQISYVMKTGGCTSGSDGRTNIGISLPQGLPVSVPSCRANCSSGFCRLRGHPLSAKTNYWP